MKVTVLNEIKIFDNKNNAFEHIQEFINNSLGESQEVYFSHMNIDGIDIYHDYELYIEEHLNDIDSIKIVVKTANEFINDITTSIYQYVERALPELKQLSDDFYQSSKASFWDKLSDLLEGIQWIHESIMLIDKEKLRPANWDKYLITASSFESNFPTLLEALEAQDNILIADILSYEITPLFQDLNRIKNDVNMGNEENIEHVEGER
ncbi:hypothetical protein [Robertmurraya andreesenii]|uniref:DUF8042 domain-containing protein n=1 Tax=Anoxybacillus andreesenii TaxID=1325932 RepID=A0ABT9V7J8_9BACL|nr:hypothetical protein [Robertmurraya andreesenii]MDQ0156916.1 hypothetical protein [Robertmurraya andreesenii]